MNVKDYHELPTGEEAIAAMREEQRYYHQLVEEKGTLSPLDMPLGGTNPQLSLHRYTSPWKITVTVLATVLLVLVTVIVLYKKTLKRQNESLIHTVTISFVKQNMVIKDCHSSFNKRYIKMFGY